MLSLASFSLSFTAHMAPAVQAVRSSAVMQQTKEKLAEQLNPFVGYCERHRQPPGLLLALRGLLAWALALGAGMPARSAHHTPQQQPTKANHSRRAERI